MDETKSELLRKYEQKFKALADQKRLEIMYELCQRGKTCVCDLTEIFEVT
ncbi:arsenical resistance operon transcriptional regulator ArsR, partial [Escherichia coli]|nr:arsenical resistance operon transcriptional regulator ArsR [Escherichia coli]